MKNSVKFFITACAAACAGSVFAGVGQTFETTSSVGTAIKDVTWSASNPGQWHGDGVVSDASKTVSADYPISSSATSKYLTIDGTVVGTNNVDSANNYFLADYLVKLVEPTGILLDQSEDDALTGAQIAVAGGTEVTGGNASTCGTVPVCLYCKTNDSLVGWVTTDQTVTTGQWHRITLMFHYGSSRCLVAVNGIPAASACGVANPTNTIDRNTGGAWHKMANNPAANIVKEMKLLGVGSVDEVVIASNSTLPTPNQFATKTANVSFGGVTSKAFTFQQLAKWGTSPSKVGTVAADNSGLTIAEKLDCGLDPTDGKKFEVQSIAVSSGGTATIVVPYTAEANSGYTVGYTVSVADKTPSVTPGAVVNGQKTLSVSGLGDDAGVQMMTVTAAAANN